MDEVELLEGLRNGESEAQLALLDQYQDKLSEYLSRFRALEPEDIKGLAAEILYRIIQKPGLIDLSKGSIADFIFRITRNRAIDLSRKHTKRKIALASLEANQIKVDEEAHTEDRYSWQEENEETTPLYPLKVTDAARRLINDLKFGEKEFEHIRLRLVEKFRPPEIASLLGISTNAERTRWHRILKKIEEKWIYYPELVEFAERLNIETSVTGAGPSST